MRTIVYLPLVGKVCLELKFGSFFLFLSYSFIGQDWSMVIRTWTSIALQNCGQKPLPPQYAFCNNPVTCLELQASCAQYALGNKLMWQAYILSGLEPFWCLIRTCKKNKGNYLLTQKGVALGREWLWGYKTTTYFYSFRVTDLFWGSNGICRKPLPEKCIYIHVLHEISGL